MSHIHGGHLLGDNFFHISTGQYTISGSTGQTVYVTASIIPLNQGGYKVTQVREYTYSASAPTNPPPIAIYMGHKQSGSPLRYNDMIENQDIAGAGGIKNYRFAVYYELKPFSDPNNEAVLPDEKIIIEHRFTSNFTASLRFEISGLYFGDHRNWAGG